MKYCQANCDSEELVDFDEEIIVEPKKKTPKYNLTLSKEVFIAIIIIMKDNLPKNANFYTSSIRYVKAMNIIRIISQARQ
jgi:hypothetical protein